MNPGKGYCQHFLTGNCQKNNIHWPRLVTTECLPPMLCVLQTVVDQHATSPLEESIDECSLRNHQLIIYLKENMFPFTVGRISPKPHIGTNVYLKLT